MFENLATIPIREAISDVESSKIQLSTRFPPPFKMQARITKLLNDSRIINLGFAVIWWTTRLLEVKRREEKKNTPIRVMACVFRFARVFFSTRFHPSDVKIFKCFSFFIFIFFAVIRLFVHLDRVPAEVPRIAWHIRVDVTSCLSLFQGLILFLHFSFFFPFNLLLAVWLFTSKY